MQTTHAISQIGPRLDEIMASGNGRVTALIDASRSFDFDAKALDAALKSYEAGALTFDHTFSDNSSQYLSFNVMPNRKVKEHVTPSEYHVGDRIARVVFSREYETQMESSPSHLVFLSALVQWQKLVYIAMCREHGVAYEPSAREIFKIWPTDIRCCLPVMVRDEERLTQDTVVSKISDHGEERWMVEGFSTVNAKLGFLARALVYRVDFMRFEGPGWRKKDPASATPTRRRTARRR